MIFIFIPWFFVILMAVFIPHQVLSLLFPRLRILFRGINFLACGSKGAVEKGLIGTVKWLLIALAVSVPCTILGLNNYYVISEQGIEYRPFGSFESRSYAWTDIKRISTKTGRSLKRYQPSYYVTMIDGTKVNLMDNSLKEFIQAYIQFRPLLKEVKGIKYETSVTRKGFNYLVEVQGEERARKFLAILQDRPSN